MENIDIIEQRRDNHKKRMEMVAEQLASLSERAAEVENSKLPEKIIENELIKLEKDYIELNKNYKEEKKAINTYNRVIGTKDVLSRENSDDKEIPVNTKPKQEEQQDIPINILPNMEPLQPTTISVKEPKVQLETKGNVIVKPLKKPRHSKKYYRNKAGYSTKAKGGKKKGGKART